MSLLKNRAPQSCRARFFSYRAAAAAFQGHPGKRCPRASSLPATDCTELAARHEPGPIFRKNPSYGFPMSTGLPGAERREARVIPSLLSCRRRIREAGARERGERVSPLPFVSFLPARVEVGCPQGQETATQGVFHGPYGQAGHGSDHCSGAAGRYGAAERRRHDVVLIPR